MSPKRLIDGFSPQMLWLALPVGALAIYFGLSAADSSNDDVATGAAGRPVAARPMPARAAAPRIPSIPSGGASLAGQPFDCVVEPFQVVKLASQVVGVIGRIDVERGDSVTRGQVVGKLDDRVEQANYALAQAKARDEYSAGAIREHLVFLRLKEDRADKLAARNFVTPAIRDEAASDTKVAEQQLRQAELNKHMAALEVVHARNVLQQKRLVSPISGVVTEILLRPGEYRNEQSPVMSLAQIDPLRVEVFIPTRYYGQVVPGTVAAVMPESPVGGKHLARVTVVDRVIDAASGTFGIRLEMPNPNHIVPAGLQCKIRFPTGAD